MKVGPRFKGPNKYEPIYETTLNVRFREEQRKINVIIGDANPDLVEQVRLRKEELGEVKTKEDLYKSICAVYLQEYEIRILERILIHCTEKKYVHLG